MPIARATLLSALLLAPPNLLAASPDSPGSGSAAQPPLTLPPGLLLPVTLSQTIHAGHTPANTSVSLRISQRVPLGNRHFIPPGTEITATVAGSVAHPASLTLQPTALIYRGQTIPLAASTIALATFIAVSATGDPANGSTDRGNPDPASWTTSQVGGDQVMRSGWYGPLINSTSQTVGSADPWGVYALPPSPGFPPLALGPFSSAARGLFGYADPCQLSRPGATSTITCSTGRLTLHHGDALLLQVMPHS